MDIKELSHTYTVRKLMEDDIELIVSLCKGNPIYYHYCPPFVTTKGIRKDMQAVPTGFSLENKYYIGFFMENSLAAVMDLLIGYPQQNIAYIGFFMVNVEIQGRAIGSSLITEVCHTLLKYGIQEIQLAWVKENSQAAHFWKKNGFIPMREGKNQNGLPVVRARKRIDCRKEYDE